jgi:hypothetical protein
MEITEKKTSGVPLGVYPFAYCARCGAWVARGYNLTGVDMITLCLRHLKSEEPECYEEHYQVGNIEQNNPDDTFYIPDNMIMKGVEEKPQQIQPKKKKRNDCSMM